MGVMITYHGYNNPVYNAHRNVGVHCTWQNPLVGTKTQNLLLLQESGGYGVRVPWVTVGAAQVLKIILNLSGSFTYPSGVPGQDPMPFSVLIRKGETGHWAGKMPTSVPGPG